MHDSVSTLVFTVPLNLLHILLHPSMLSLHKSTLSIYKVEFSLNLPKIVSLLLDFKKHYSKKRSHLLPNFHLHIKIHAFILFFKQESHFLFLPLKLRTNLLLLFACQPINTITILGKLGEHSMDLVALSVWLSWSVLIADCYGVCASRLFSARCVFGHCWLCWRCAPLSSPPPHS